MALNVAFASSGRGGSDGSVVVLDSTNGFTDTLEPGATISQSGGFGPVVGMKVEFSCGLCAVATFLDAVPQLGGGFGICGYGGGVFGSILDNDDQLCARSTVSGQRHDIDFLSHVGSVGCSDADGGASCAAAGNRTSYLRIAGTENTPTTTGTPTQTNTPTETSPPTSTPVPCVGDCDDNRAVEIDELVRLVNIALGIKEVSECLTGDQDGNGSITINELVRAVNHALDGCPSDGSA